MKKKNIPKEISEHFRKLGKASWKKRKERILTGIIKVEKNWENK